MTITKPYTYTAVLRFELAAMTNVFLTVICHQETKSYFSWLTHVKCNGGRFVQHLFWIVNVKAKLTAWFALYGLCLADVSLRMFLCASTRKEYPAFATWTNTHKSRLFLPSDMKLPLLFTSFLTRIDPWIGCLVLGSRVLKSATVLDCTQTALSFLHCLYASEIFSCWTIGSDIVCSTSSATVC